MVMIPVSNNVYEIINKGTIIELFSTILTELFWQAKIVSLTLG
jgi:hypothetical protein